MPRVLNTHCPSGHEFDYDNTYWTKSGSRKCRICSSAAAGRAQARRTAAARLQRASELKVIITTNDFSYHVDGGMIMSKNWTEGDTVLANRADEIRLLFLKLLAACPALRSMEFSFEDVPYLSIQLI